MAKGQIAKDKFFARMGEVFGADWLGIVDKKGYLVMDDGGEKVQLAISLTVPKTPVATIPTSSSGHDFEDAAAPTIAPTGFTPAEITQEEKDNIQKLFEKLGL